MNYNVPAQYVGTLAYTGIYNTTDKNFYDYERINFAGLNFGKKNAELARIELEQYLYQSSRHTLAAQLGFFRENISDYSRNFVGLGGDGYFGAAPEADGLVRAYDPNRLRALRLQPLERANQKQRSA